MSMLYIWVFNNLGFFIDMNTGLKQNVFFFSYMTL